MYSPKLLNRVPEILNTSPQILIGPKLLHRGTGVLNYDIRYTKLFQRSPEVLYAAPSYTPYCCLLHRNRNKQVLRSSVLLHHSCSILQHRAQLLHNNLVTPAFYTEAPKYYSPPSYYTEAYTSYAKPDNYTNAPQNYATAFYYTTKARSTTVLRRPSTTPLPMLLQRTTLKFQSTIDGPKDFNW